MVNHKRWFHETIFRNGDKEFSSGISNLSLLLASSQSTIIGFYIVDGSIDSIMFLDFMVNMMSSINENRLISTDNSVFIMDNSKVYKNVLMEGFYNKMNIKVVFTSSYSSETNFIEHVFERIKRKYRKMPRVKDK